MRIIPIVLIVAAIALFFGYTNPLYQSTQTLKEQSGQYNDAISNATELQRVRDSLRETYNTFSANNLTRLEKFLPDSVNNVRLIIDISALASRYGITLKNIKLNSTTATAIVDNTNSGSSAVAIYDPQKYGTYQMSFSVNSSYKNFVQFLRQLESSLRLVEVQSVTFTSSDTDMYQFDIGLQTFWLK